MTSLSVTQHSPLAAPSDSWLHVPVALACPACGAAGGLCAVLSPEMVSALVPSPVPGGAGSYDPTRMEAAWAGSPRVPRSSRPESPSSAAQWVPASNPVPVSRPESGCGTHGGRTIPSAGGRAGGCRRRGACCNRDRSAVSGCPRSNQTEKGLSFLWEEGEQDAPLSGQQSCLLVSACSERVGGIVWAWIKGRKI